MVTGGDRKAPLAGAGSSTSLLAGALGAAVRAITATTAQFAALEQMKPPNAKAFHFPSK